VPVVAYENSSGAVPVRGFLHEPEHPSGDGLILAHGAGSDARSSLLVAIANVFASHGFAVLRIDLPYRQERPKGSPHPSRAGRDQEGIAAALAAMRNIAPKRLFAGGQSYGGRMTTMAVAETPGIAAGLLLTSYPLHPPGQPEKLRTAHLSRLRLPCLFVHGTKDPFGSIEEMKKAMRAIPGPVELFTVEGAGHDLGGGKKHQDVWTALPGRLLTLAGR
jgi:predicted alpha/beta-hydrolase family hydrolase